MDASKAKKNLISKTWDRCRSVRSNKSYSSSSSSFSRESKRSESWHGSTDKTKCQVAPDGCFTVLVGAEKRRFVVKTECVNHPMFKALLEDAESEYGFCTEGPIVLPCDADLFYRVLAEMETTGDR